MSITKQDALDYHRSGRKGKLEVVATKPCATAHDLSLAYTPGVAVPCLAIEKNPDNWLPHRTLGEIYEYGPTVPEVLISMGVWATGALIYTLLLKFAIPIYTGKLRFETRQ